MTASKYILTRLLRFIDGRIFGEGEEVLYSCLKCEYVGVKSLVNTCPCCSRKLDVLTGEDKETPITSKIFRKAYKEAYV